MRTSFFKRLKGLFCILDSPATEATDPTKNIFSINDIFSGDLEFGDLEGSDDESVEEQSRKDVVTEEETKSDIPAEQVDDLLKVKLFSDLRLGH